MENPPRSVDVRLAIVDLENFLRPVVRNQFEIAVEDGEIVVKLPECFIGHLERRLRKIGMRHGVWVGILAA